MAMVEFEGGWLRTDSEMLGVRERHFHDRRSHN